MFIKKEKRFEKKFKEDLDFGTMIILLDKVTGVNYLLVGAPDGFSLTPLLDSNGNIVIDK